MSKINDLLLELCPDGVQFLRVDQVCVRKSGLPLTAGEMKVLNTTGGDVRIFAGGQTFADVNSESIDGKYIEGPGLIVKSRGIIDFEFWLGPYSHKNELWSYQPKNEVVNLKFLYYFLKTKVLQVQLIAKANSVKMPQIKVGDIDGMLIPVPPLEIQNEIVSILDTFTELASELEAELTARYQLRTWLQDELLKHRLIEATSPSQMMPITKAAEYIRGLTYSKSAEDIAGTIRVLRANNIDQESGTLNFRDVRCLATGTKVKREQKLSEGDILMSAASGSRSHVGKVAYINDDLDYYFGGFMAVFRVRKNIHSPYLFHILSSRGFQEFLDRAIESTTINNLSASLLEKFLIPVPDLKTQIEVSRRLDTLNCLIQDLRSELEMRHQQFDYFRGKLLTFKELEVA